MMGEMTVGWVAVVVLVAVATAESGHMGLHGLWSERQTGSPPDGFVNDTCLKTVYRNCSATVYANNNISDTATACNQSLIEVSRGGFLRCGRVRVESNACDLAAGLERVGVKGSGEGRDTGSLVTDKRFNLAVVVGWVVSF